MNSRHERISVVVPTLEEEASIEACLRRLLELGADEIIVVDGGSRDRTLHRSRPLAHQVLVEAGGLFHQLNRGAACCRGDVLLFHYADGVLPTTSLEAIRSVVREEWVSGGAFRLRFSENSIALRCIAFGANLRNRFGFGPFGDQSIFARTATFRELGGFRTDAFLADYELVRALRRRGRFRILELPVESSARRWHRDGVFRTLASHWHLSAQYALGRRRVDASLLQTLRRLRSVR